MVAVTIAAALTSGCESRDFVSQEQRIKDELTQVKAELQRRNDLIPGLIDRVKPNATQQQSLFQALADSRTRFARAQSTEEIFAAANQQSQALEKLSALVEKDPQLKADESLKQPMTDLIDTEIRLSVERMRYDARVQEFETNRRQFPGGLAAGIFNFRKYPFFAVPPPEGPK